VDHTEAARVLGVRSDTPWPEVRRAYRARIRIRHPDRAGASGVTDAVRIIEAFRTLDAARGERASDPSPPPPPPFAEPGQRRVFRWVSPEGTAPSVARIDSDTLALDAPADETFRWLIEAANDIGEITYVDRSGPVLEVLCRFEGEPATSLMITLQGRVDGTEAFCTAESIEARPAPPTTAVVDLLELALRRRQAG